VYHGRLVMIDLPQMVDVIAHPTGRDYLARDAQRGDLVRRQGPACRRPGRARGPSGGAGGPGVTRPVLVSGPRWCLSCRSCRCR
jgi:hypothetical protein